MHQAVEYHVEPICHLMERRVIHYSAIIFADVEKELAKSWPSDNTNDEVGDNAGDQEDVFAKAPLKNPPNRRPKGVTNARLKGRHEKRKETASKRGEKSVVGSSQQVNESSIPMETCIQPPVQEAPVATRGCNTVGGGRSGCYFYPHLRLLNHLVCTSVIARWHAVVIGCGVGLILVRKREGKRKSHERMRFLSFEKEKPRKKKEREKGNGVRFPSKSISLLDSVTFATCHPITGLDHMPPGGPGPGNNLSVVRGCRKDRFGIVDDFIGFNIEKCYLNINMSNMSNIFG
ncbi:hypothetical protein RIF29_16080 [Crotalaria pallida]|uniref:Uncharacterized protein n=1 Tax=Crotalaria pallida TaxID=3830 RepID=A0AAN9FEF9_CROPI